MPDTVAPIDTAPAESDIIATLPPAPLDDADAEDAAAADNSNSTGRLVPVTEAIRYRKRAQTAEQQLSDATKRLKVLQAELNESQQTIDQLERRHRINTLLSDADAIDMDVARLLTEAAVEMMAEPDVEAAIDELRRAKPYLFRHRPAPAAQAMSAHERDDTPHHADRAAEQAATTGRRQDLLRYLRLRRSPA